MIRNLLIATCLALLSLETNAQTVNIPTLSETATSIGLPGGANRTRSFMYDNENAKVVISEGANAKFYWEFGTSSGTTSLNETSNILNPDIVLGNGGRTVMVVYQIGSGVYWERFNWNGSTFLYTNDGTIAVNVSEGFVFGNPRIDLEESTDSIAVTFISYGNSPELEAYVKMGNISGNFNNAGGQQGAYNLTENLNRPIDSTASPVSVSVYNEDSRLIVHFAIVYYKANGDQTFEHYCLDRWTLLSNNRMGSRQMHVLNNEASRLYGRPEIDTWHDYHVYGSTGLRYSDEDYWAASVNSGKAGVSTIHLHRGYGSGQNFTDETVNPNWITCGLGNVGVAYVNDMIQVVYQHNSNAGCGSDSVFDSFETLVGAVNFLPNSAIVGPTSFTHYRINNTLSGSQRSPSICGTISVNAFVSFADIQNGDIKVKVSDSEDYKTGTVSSLNSLEKFSPFYYNGITAVRNNIGSPIDLEVYNMSGTLVEILHFNPYETKELNGNIISGLYLLRYGSDSEKIVLQ